MKTVTIKLKVSPEKYAAVEQFMEEKGLQIEKELSNFIAKLYQKHVPAPVRKYIEATAQDSKSSAEPKADSSSQSVGDDAKIGSFSSQ